MGPKTPPNPGEELWLHAEHKHVHPRLIGIRRLMIEIPEKSPCYLSTNQSEENPQAATSPQTSLKPFPWKPSGSLGLVSTSFQFSLIGVLQQVLIQ